MSTLHHRIALLPLLVTLFILASQPRAVVSQHQGHQMPPTTAPAATPTPALHPASEPHPAASPAPDAAPEKTEPSHAGMDMPAEMSPLLVMSGDDMAIRVGSSDTNLISMGAMGSGTSWQPSSTP